MHADFASAGKAARAYITVPALDMETIRYRAEASGLRARVRHMVLSAAIALGLVGAAVALAANVGGVRIWMFGDKADVLVQSFAQVRDPMAADVAAIIHRASFRAVIPSDIPKGMRVQWIAYSPAERPNLIQIVYERADGSLGPSVALVDTSTIQSDRATVPAGVIQTKLANGRDWRVGNETVLAGNAPPALAAAMRTSMRNESPSDGLAAIDAHLWKVTVLGVAQRVANIAEKRAPAGKNVLFGRQGIGLIAGLAAHSKPMRDYRTVYLVNVPNTNGKPDYAHAKIHWPKAIALSPAGVRVVAETLQNARIRPQCGCAILVNRRAGKYAVWKIDEKTLTVTAL